VVSALKHLNLIEITINMFIILNDEAVKKLLEKDPNAYPGHQRSEPNV
jgi:hypothetical protein